MLTLGVAPCTHSSPSLKLRFLTLYTQGHMLPGVCSCCLLVHIGAFLGSAKTGEGSITETRLHLASDGMGHG